MSDRPLSVHVRAAALLYKKLKLSGLFEDKENQTSARRLRTADLNCIRDLEKYLKVVGSVIPNHPSYRRRRNDADIKELEVRFVLFFAFLFWGGELIYVRSFECPNH